MSPPARSSRPAAAGIQSTVPVKGSPADGSEAATGPAPAGFDGVVGVITPSTPPVVTVGGLKVPYCAWAAESEGAFVLLETAFRPKPGGLTRAASYPSLSGSR